MRQELDELNDSIGEDENGMTVHEKLDSLINKSKELKLIGATNSFNIANIVGSENVGKYTADDFLCVPNFANGSQSSQYGPINLGHHYFITRKALDFTINYDNTTGDVNISNMELDIDLMSASLITKYTWSIPPLVYLFV